MKNRMTTLVLKKFCADCGRRYTWKSRGYRNNGRCICGGELLVKPRFIGRAS